MAAAVAFGNGRRSKSGKPLHGAAGRPLTPEAQARLQEARRRKMAEGKPGGGQGLGTKAPTALATTEALKELEPAALKVMRDIFDDPEAPRKLRFDAAVKVLEYGLGRPAQRVEQEQVGKIVYQLAAFEPPPRGAGNS